MKLPTPMQSLSLVGVAAVLLAIPLFFVGVVLGRLHRRSEPRRLRDYILLPPTD
jgi:hypothetical protein